MKLKALVLALCLTFLLAGCRQPPAKDGNLTVLSSDNPRFLTQIPAAENGAARLEQPAAPLSPVEQEWGIRIMSLRTASNGYMLDFRFKVLDPAKALPLLDKTIPATLVHARTGATMNVPTTPKVGALRQKTATPKAGRTYFMFFGNPGQLVRPGEEVSIVIGNFRADRLTVQ